MDWIWKCLSMNSTTKWNCFRKNRRTCQKRWNVFIYVSWEFSSNYDTNYTELHGKFKFLYLVGKHQHCKYIQSRDFPNHPALNTNNWLINYWASLKSTAFSSSLPLCLCWAVRNSLHFHNNLPFVFVPRLFLRRSLRIYTFVLFD